MKIETTDLDPEIEVIKGKLQVIGIMIAAAALVLPFQFPIWTNVPTIAAATLAGAYTIFKYKESKPINSGVKS